jgi:cytidylate kinase
MDTCFSFIRTQLEPRTEAARLAEAKAAKLAITISRQTGTGGLAIAERLAKLLEKRGPAPDKPWTVFDKNIVQEVIKRHNLPQELGDYMTEGRTSEIQDMVEEVLGLHPSSWELVRRVTETILTLAAIGNVILVGRGANIITARLPHVFHVRIVGALERRIERLRRFEKVSERVARRLVEESDEARRRYVKKHFKKDIEDALLYDLVLNTDRIADETAARLIAEAALAHGTSTPG